ncbi:ArsR/SmtB family transcription factor [Tengunoibacter tsumagoiensis]|uniref:HTH arsR-type domain-containing protein n=1 Tax=Tengunoibacter tsumagoiensis TaxID=2014871 RepID=A0A402A581_9CHLR|nr:metalloregulator ArsR/SmtB family transcription factor [Tengunoibacter tsumagoiensis]GCE14165.1 hypothetical protein KTT_40240 [Tengunoibacter tsumagoiensis]GCE14219.1 hypothetical protein KTT_40780 [Tengunoibacter tsumagoiensis]
MSVTRPASTPIAARLAALGNDTRLKILRFLATHRADPVSVKELTQSLEVPQATVSRHVATLRAAGLVVAGGGGQKGRGYTINKEGLIEAVHDAEHCTGFDELSPVLPLQPMFDECE